MKRPGSHRWSFWLVFLLVLGSGCVRVRAQAAAAASSSAAPRALFIEVLEGEGELNDVRARTAREPIVEVQDKNHKPVAGALVLFSVHGSGGAPAGASFSGLTELRVRTGPDGRAVGRGYQLSNHTGPVRIDVEAVLAGVVATTVIHQTNYAHGNALARTLSAHKATSAFVAEVVAVAAVSTVEVVNAQTGSTTITAGTGVVRQARVRH